ncbi:hypothetical protein [Draconibacterium mangrovi]|uniref:hypothetical protein n=1 Tax=Draconibacterium mangrovi TaxID=2697469 RepID=UPI0013D6A0B9|nr:hypothetical protein [Draconibacterium mangrovi]
MKKSILFILLIAVVSMFNSCETPPMEAAQDAYDYDAIIPEVLGGVDGPSIAIQTFTADFTIGYYRGGSTWNWSVEDAVIESVSEDTRVATVRFADFPADGIATITVSETTMGGITSDPASIDVTVQKYCPLTNGEADLVGSWQGTDAVTDGYTEGLSQVVTAVDGGKLMITGLGVDWMTNFWGEEIIDGGTVELIVNEDGTVEIEEQYYITTVYDGEEQDPYTIRGSGSWDNCGGYPSLIIEYEMNNFDTDWGAWTYENGYSTDPIFTATLTLDPEGLKSAVLSKSLKSISEESFEMVRKNKLSSR